MNNKQRENAVNAAIEYARRSGYEIIERNPTDSIDFVAWERDTDMMAFVAVRWHEKMKPARRPFCGKMLAVRREITRWCRQNKWEKSRTRIDAIHVYGDERPVIDHFENVIR